MTPIIQVELLPLRRAKQVPAILTPSGRAHVASGFSPLLPRSAPTFSSVICFLLSVVVDRKGE